VPCWKISGNLSAGSNADLVRRPVALEYEDGADDGPCLPGKTNWGFGGGRLRSGDVPKGDLEVEHAELSILMGAGMGMLRVGDSAGSPTTGRDQVLSAVVVAIFLQAAPQPEISIISRTCLPWDCQGKPQANCTTRCRDDRS